jgi:NAD(P)H-dependent flavin oxidoreductase YrpB (nitropropane dioxygenase family)
MIRTPVCDLLGIEHPVALGGLGGGHTRPELVAAVSEAGGFGAQGCHGMNVAQIGEAAATLRGMTDRPFALNFLLFHCDEEQFDAGVAEKPAAIAIAWPRPDQDLEPYIARAHDAGCKVTLMAGGVPEALRGAEAGADVIIAQGTEGGGHVSWMATMALTPMVVDAVAPIPVLAAGGIADGRGLAAALALGADGVLLGTRFLATPEAPLHPNFKRAILDSDGHDTMLTEIPDIASGTVWPGAMSRAARNRFVERWAGREWQLRQHQADLYKGVLAARKSGDRDEATLSYGQDAGLIHDILPAGEVVRRIVAEAEAILKGRLPGLVV